MYTDTDTDTDTQEHRNRHRHRHTDRQTDRPTHRHTETDTDPDRNKRTKKKQQTTTVSPTTGQMHNLILVFTDHAEHDRKPVRACTKPTVPLVFVLCKWTEKQCSFHGLMLCCPVALRTSQEPAGSTTSTTRLTMLRDPDQRFCVAVQGTTSLLIA